MKAIKVELIFINHENIREEEDVRHELKNVKYLYPTILSLKSKEIGEWHDDHPLNKKETFSKTAKEIFNQVSHEKIKEWIEDQQYYLGTPEDIGDGQHFEYHIEPRVLEQLILSALEELK